jgi:divalent metal cation (Fe/Co/Zn/Cd) transporter
MDTTLSSKTIVWVELIADVLVALVKLFAAFFTGRAAIAAEGVHSVVDVGSGGLMLYGYRRAQLGPSKRHPLGHGRELYFWSFVVALLFFTLGAGYSIFEGVRRTLSPADIRSPLVIYAVRRRKLCSMAPRLWSLYEPSAQRKAISATGRR